MNDTTCTVSEGNTVYFSCVVYDRCNISILWYKNRNIKGSTEQVTGSLEPGGKFQIFGIHIEANSSNLAGYCSTVSVLVINNFNHTNDSGYYWCRILANGSSLLLPSPWGYVSLKSEGDQPCGNGDLNHYLSPRLCAEYPISTEPATSTRMMLTSESTQHDNETESNTSRTTSSSTILTVSLMTNEKDLLFGTIIGILLSAIVLILMILLCLVIALYRNRQKRGKLSCLDINFSYITDIIVGHAIKAHKVVGLETSPAQETVSNPHYRKIAHLCTDNCPQHESSKSKQLSIACTNSHSGQCEEEGGYYVIETAQMQTKDKMMNIDLLGSETYEERFKLNQNVAYSRSEKHDLSAANQESSPLSHYEVIRGQPDHKELDNTTRSSSPEYAEIISKDESQQKEMEEQHYYHRPDVHYDTEYYSSMAEIACTDEPNSCDSTHSLSCQ